MKTKLIAIVLTLLSASQALTTGRTLSVKQLPPIQSFSISKYGTLLEVFDKSGKSRFGKLERDGFRVTYKTKGHKAKVVSAVGSTQVKGLLPGEVKFDGRLASATVMTEDKKLEITSYFRMDEAGNTLIIRRKIKNTSCEKVWLTRTRYFLEPAFFVPSGRESFDLMALAKTQIIAWGDDICPSGACDSEVGGCQSNVCPPLSMKLDEDNVTLVGGGEVLAECPCGPPDKKPANEASASVKIAMARAN